MSLCVPLRAAVSACSVCQCQYASVGVGTAYFSCSTWCTDVFYELCDRQCNECRCQHCASQAAWLASVLQAASLGASTPVNARINNGGSQSSHGSRGALVELLDLHTKRGGWWGVRRPRQAWAARGTTGCPAVPLFATRTELPEKRAVRAPPWTDGAALELACGSLRARAVTQTS